MKLKIYKILFVLLIILAIIVITFIALKYIRNQINKKDNEEIIETFSREIGTRRK